jgi:hypothetical protein
MDGIAAVVLWLDGRSRQRRHGANVMRDIMMKHLLAAVIAAAFLAATAGMSPTLSQKLQAATGAPAKSTSKSTTNASDGRAAMHARQKQCGTEWKAAKAAGTIEKGQTWPKYWSACNKRLKAANG